MITARGLAEWLNALGKLAEPPSIETMRDVGEMLSLKVRESFDGQYDPYGHPWKPLSPLTVRLKGHAEILYETGALKNSIDYEAFGDGSVAIGLTDWKAPFHQEGTDRIPARPMLPWQQHGNSVDLPRDWEERAGEIIANAYAKRLSR